MLTKLTYIPSFRSLAALISANNLLTTPFGDRFSTCALMGGHIDNADSDPLTPLGVLAGTMAEELR